MYWMGLDVGTSGCKAAVFADTGEMVSLSYQEYQLQIDECGKAELDSQLVLRSVHKVIKTVASAVAGEICGTLCVQSGGGDYSGG